MKKNNLKDALREVIAFAWSLIELLFTRILPLAGLLASHLLLQFCRLLAFSLFAAAGSHRPQADYSSDVQAGEFIEEDYVQVVEEGGDDHNELMSLKSINKLEKSLTHDERLHSETSAAAAIPAALEVVATSTPTDVAPEVVTESEVVAKEMKVGSSDYGYVAAKKLDPAFNVLSEVEQRGTVNQEGSSASDVETTGRTGGEMRKRMPRVLPPSPSQVKRTILALSQGKGEAPLPYQPSPTKKMKKQTVSPRSHNRVSPTLASSSSYDNFMGKFRNHFLLDPALFM